MSRPEPLIAPSLRRALASVPGHWKPAVIGAMYVMATCQRRWGERRMADWPLPDAEAGRRLDADVVVLSCERDRLLIMRMVSSLLTHVGTPRSITVVSDGSLSAASAGALERLAPVVSVVDWRAFCAGVELPEAVLTYAAAHPLGKKLAMLLALDRWPALVLDSDIEFFRGGARLARLLADPAETRVPRYQDNGEDAYDTRLSAGMTLLPAVCSGVLVLPGPLDWAEALARLRPAADTGGPWTEQTAVAIALTAARARALDPADYVVYWGDIKYPWDHVAGTDVVLRHYLADLQRWKLWMRGGPGGPATLAVSLPVELLRHAGSWARHRLGGRAIAATGSGAAALGGGA